MHTIQAIMTRRSIRRFEKREIEEQMIETLLRAAMQAPSGQNRQPWHFIAITERRILSAIPKFHPNAKMLHKAPAAILVCGDTRIEESIKYINSDCSAATENLLLAAHELGLGAVWLGIYSREDRVERISRLLELPPYLMPISLVAVGYAAETKQPEDRFRPERVHRNRWTGEGS
jgi:nitroreductase